MTKRSLVLGLAGVLLIGGLSFAATQEGGKTISQAEAEKIMLNKIPNGKIEKIYLDERDREYKAIVKKGNEVYEIEVDSLNGNITEFEIEDMVNQNNNSNKPDNEAIYDDDKDDYDDKYDDIDDDKDDHDDKYDDVDDDKDDHDDKYDDVDDDKDDHDDKYDDVDDDKDDYDDKYDDDHDED